MKRTLLGAGAACLFFPLMFAQAPAGSDRGAPAVPGSAVEPPKVIASVLPKPAPQEQAGAKLGLWIKEDGSVDEVDFLEGTESWTEAAKTAAKQWRFAPVVWQGKPLVARTELSFSQASPTDIRWSLMPDPNLPDEVHTEDEFGLTKPVIESDPDLILPLITRSRANLNLAVAINYEVEPDGTTDKISVAGADSEEAVRLGLDIISRRVYKPGRIRDVPVKVRYQQVINYQSVEQPIEALAGADTVPDPAYPYDRLVAGDEGYAVVKFKLAADGSVQSAESAEASKPDFAGALVAAVETWHFAPEEATAQPEREIRYDFSLANAPYAERRLAEGVRAGQVTPNAAAGLDARPKLLVRPGLAYPTKLFGEKVQGTAEVEFVIDRVGLAQLPHVLKASRPEFGWTAAAAVNRMRFVPLTKGGHPVELRVRLPFKFTPPSSSAGGK